MPFDFYHPKPPTPIVDRFDKKPRGTRNWPVDRYDTTGGSFPLRPENENHCDCSPGGKQNDDRNYTKNFLRDQMHQNPGALCGLRNSAMAKDILGDPEIKLVPPHFLHKSGRSTSHIRIPRKYRKAVCKINENLKKDHAVTNNYEIRRLRVERKNHAHMHADVTKKTESASSVSSVSENLLSRSSSGMFESAESEYEDSLMNYCLTGQLLNHVRERVQVDIIRQELEDKEKTRFKFPSKSQLILEIDQISRNPALYPKERYSYDPNSAMAMLCARKQILAKFYESESQQELAHPPKGLFDADGAGSLFRRNPLPQLKRRKFTPSMLEMITKAPTRSHKGPIIFPEPVDPFSHLGLIETAKKDALMKMLVQLDQRERNVSMPEELVNTMYGPIKEMPEGAKIELPKIFQINYPPQSTELEKVDKALKHDEGLEKRRRSQGLKSLTPSNTVIQRFTKSLIESEEEIPASDQQQKSLSIAEEYFRDRVHELHIQDSSDTLLSTVSNKAIVENNKETNENSLEQPWITEAKSDILESIEDIKKIDISERKHTAKKLDPLNTGRLPKITLSKISEYLIDDDEDTEQYPEVADSGESLLENSDYSDIAFSDIDPPKNVPGIRKNTLYQALARETASSDDNDMEENSSESRNFSEDEFDVDESEEEDIDEEKNDLKTDSVDPEVQEKAEIKNMFETLRNEEHPFKSPDPEWQKLKKVEPVPSQIKLKEPRIDARDMHYPILEIVYGSKSVKEDIRQKRVSDPALYPEKSAIENTHQKPSLDEDGIFHAVHFTQTESHTYEYPSAVEINATDGSELDTLPFEMTDEEEEDSDGSYLKDGSTATEVHTSQSSQATMRRNSILKPSKRSN